MLYYFKWAWRWLFDLPDNSCNTLPWRTRDVRIYIKYILINHSASIKNKERHPALPLLGYRMPPWTTRSIRACFFKSDRADRWPVAGQGEDAPDPRTGGSLLQGSPCRWVEDEGRSWKNRMGDAGAQSQGWVLVGPCPISMSFCRARDAANPLVWVQQGRRGEDASVVRHLFSS